MANFDYKKEANKTYYNIDDLSKTVDDLMKTLFAYDSNPTYQKNLNDLYGKINELYGAVYQLCVDNYIQGKKEGNKSK